MDFSVHEQRRLALIERDLSSDRRLAAMMGVFDRQPRLRRMRCLAVRARHPWYGPIGPRPRSLSRLTFALSIAVTLLAPPMLIAAVVANLEGLAIAATAAVPVGIVLLIVSYRRTRRSSDIL